jgi:signal transduction histidine kinase
MAHAGRLFEPFRRMHQESEFSGIGIGLAIVRRVVQRHGGRVWAEARKDEGASFFVVLPPAPAPA